MSLDKNVLIFWVGICGWDPQVGRIAWVLSLVLCREFLIELATVKFFYIVCRNAEAACRESQFQGYFKSWIGNGPDNRKASSRSGTSRGD